MDMIFLGTGGAWGLPEIRCDCSICRTLRARGEKRDRTSLLLSGSRTLLVDCGPDARDQLARNRVKDIDGVLITHEHGDHFIGLDELFTYKRNVPREGFDPIPVYLTKKTLETIAPRFGYLQDMGVLRFIEKKPGQWFSLGEFAIYPFKTEHGAFATGSVGYLFSFKGKNGRDTRLLYTSDFMDIPDMPREIMNPDYLVIQSFWLNEPEENRPHHMSFQRALEFIELLRPGRETFIVHIGDADMVPGDPSNRNAKKYKPGSPLTPQGSDSPYPIPLCHEQWQDTVDRILSDRGLQYKVTVTWDDLKVSL